MDIAREFGTVKSFVLGSLAELLFTSCLDLPLHESGELETYFDN